MSRKRLFERSIEPSPTDCAYAAGFVDGEGSIAITPTWHDTPDGRRREGYSCVVQVTQQDSAPLRWLQDRWGGNIYPHESGYTEHPCWRLYVRGAIQAGRFCQDIVPYLIVKQLQAENLLAFSASRTRGVKGQKITEEELTTQRQFHVRSLDLNRKGA